MKKIGWIVCIAMFALCAVAQAAEVDLKWQANTPAPTGYMAFARQVGQQYNYATPAWQGPETACKVTVPDDAEHLFVVRAYVKSATTGLVSVSGDSNEVRAIVGPKPPDNPKGLIIEAIDKLVQGLLEIKEAVGKL